MSFDKLLILKKSFYFGKTKEKKKFSDLKGLCAF